MGVRKHIPNALTLSNLFCGVLAIAILLTTPDQEVGAICVAILMSAAMVFDFFDGFAARMLKVASPIGKDLDSLADMVTFGVLPGIFIYLMLIGNSELPDINLVGETDSAWKGLGAIPVLNNPIPLIGIFIPLFSALRLAKFNNDERQSSVFYGLATPANAFFWLSIYLIFVFDSKWNLLLNLDPNVIRDGNAWELFTHPSVLVILTVLFCYLLVGEIPLMANKFKGFGFKQNWPKYIFAGLSVILLAILFYKAVPLIILMYFVFSALDKYLVKKNEIPRKN